MPDTEKLKNAIANSGMKRKFIAKQLGISYYGLQKKVNGDTDFKGSEIALMRDILRLSNDEAAEIFLA